MTNPVTAAQSEHPVAELRSKPSGPALGRVFGAQAKQKLLAFLSLILLIAFFSLASRAFAQIENFLAVLQATAVVGVLGVASTFPIITAGIDLSVGTLMTFCAVMAGVFLAKHI
jgi:ribose transport system permease protein